MTETTAPPADAACETPAVPMLRVENVTQAFPRPDGEPLVVLNDVSLEVCDIPGRGQIRSLLGPSGCGKTTLFRIIAGLDRPQQGRVLLTRQLVPVRIGMVGVIFQSYPLFEHMTVLGNLVHPARCKGVPARQARERANEFLEFFTLTEKAKAYPVELSGGQRQRVAILQQLMTDKAFLVMDEPFSGLDMVNGLRLADMIARITASEIVDTTILVVTHDISMAAVVSDRIHLMGRVRDEAGEVVPNGGARVLKEYDLVERGLAYRPDITSMPEYHRLRAEIAQDFAKL